MYVAVVLIVIIISRHGARASKTPSDEVLSIVCHEGDSTLVFLYIVIIICYIVVFFNYYIYPSFMPYGFLGNKIPIKYSFKFNIYNIHIFICFHCFHPFIFH